MSAGVARGVDDLTAEWLTAALGVEVRAVAAERVGTGQIGTSYRLTLDGDGGPPTLVAKLAGGDEEARARVKDGYRQEVSFYTELVDSLEVRAPRCWYGAITEDSMDFTLLLEDLAPRVPGVQAEGCSPDQAADAVGNLVGLHAPRWGDPTLWDLEFVRRPSAEGAAFLRDVLVPATEEFLGLYADQLSGEDAATLRDSAAAIADWMLARPEPFAVLHGDYRLDNLMFPPEGDGVVALDWQTVTVAPPLRDVAYFLGTSLHTEDRRVAEERLVADYHAALVERGVSGYGADRCWEDYRLGHLQAPYITVLGRVYATAERSDRADGMFLAMARRSCAAIRDLDSIGLL